MDLKTIALPTLLLISFFLLQKEATPEEQLIQTLQDFSQAEIEGDFEASLAFYYPPLLADIPEEKIQKALKSKETNFHVKSYTLSPRLPIKSYKDGLYTLITYTKEAEIDFTPHIHETDSEKVKAYKTKLLNDPVALKKAVRMGLMFLRMDLQKGDTLHKEKNSSLVKLTKSGSFLTLCEKGKEWKVLMAPKEKLKSLLPSEIINEEQLFIAHMEDSMLLNLFGKR